jgi:hypothetical protein
MKSSNHKPYFSIDRLKGQSFIELALILPVMLLMLMGLVEVSIYIDRYLDILDLTREAARFASLRDPFVPALDQNCSTELFDFYYDTSCIFSPPGGDASCVPNDPFCNGINASFRMNPATDDIVISVYTVTDNAVSNTWPAIGYWAFSDHDTDTVHNGNWTTDCDGNVVRSSPYYTQAHVTSLLEANAPPKRGFVAVEAYICHEQALGLPVVSQFIPNPIRVHAYTIMSLPAAQPTPTPIP